MPDSPSDPVARQVHRLFHFGALGTMSDAELLDRFASRADEAAEAAFEELVIRHGPMVLRVCRSVLGDGRARCRGRISGHVSRAGEPGPHHPAGSIPRKLALRGRATRGKSRETRQRAPACFEPEAGRADPSQCVASRSRARLGGRPRRDRGVARAASGSARALLPGGTDLRRRGESAWIVGADDPGPAGAGP